MGKKRKTIIIAGSGRSGTTWLANIIAAPRNFTWIFEPLHPAHIKAAVKIYRQYFRLDELNPEANIFFSKIFKGGLRKLWTYRKAKYFIRFWARNKVAKFIRANLLLGWLSNNFGYPTIFMVRHPCAIVASRKSLGWRTDLNIFLKQEKLIADFLHPYMNIINRADSEIEKATVLWCIENLVPLRQFRQFNWIPCIYEYLYLEPEQEIQRIYNSLDLRPSQTVFNEIENISHVTRKTSALKTGTSPLEKWKSELSGDEISKILGILESFEIQIYNDSAVPNPAIVSQIFELKEIPTDQKE